jgi:hypothetical protein
MIMVGKHSLAGKVNLSIALAMAFVFFGIGLGLCAAAPAVTAVTHENSRLLVLSLVSQEPDPAMAGDTFDLRIGVENDGGVSAENVVLEITDQYPFELVSSQDSIVTVGTISPYQADSDMRISKVTLKIDPQANAGSYPLKVLVYEDGKKGQFSSEKLFTVSVGSQAKAQVVSIDKTELVPGKQTPIKFVVKNVGLSPLKDISFSWISEDNAILPVGSDNTRHIDYLGVGQETTLEYTVSANADASAGLCKLDLYLSYEDSITGTERATSTVAGVYVGGGTEFDVAYSEASGSEVSLTVANVGSNPAYSVSVAIPEQDGWRVTGSDTMVIGNLNTGDYTLASFTVQSAGMGRNSSTGSGVNPLKVNVIYTDTRGERKVYESKVSLSGMAVGNGTFSGSMEYASANGSARYARGGQNGMGGLTQGMSGLATIAIWGIAAIIALAAAYFLYRRHKAKRAADAKRHLLDGDSSKLAGQKGRK